MYSLRPPLTVAIRLSLCCDTQYSLFCGHNNNNKFCAKKYVYTLIYMLSSEELDSSYSEFINFVLSQVYSCPIIGVYIQ